MTDAPRDPKREGTTAGMLKIVWMSVEPALQERGRMILAEAGFRAESVSVETDQELMAALAPRADVVLAGTAGSGAGVWTALHVLRERDCDVPLIVLAGSIGEDAVALAMRMGASDFVHSERLEQLGEAVQLALKVRSRREECRRAEQRQQEQARLLDLAQDAILIQQFRPRRILFWNKGAEQLYGWSREEAIERDPAELFASAQTLGEMEQALLRGGEWRAECTQRTHDARELTVIASATLLRDDEGAPASVLMINTDLTERKRLEETLYRAQRLESIGSLASGVAHDLSNVLSPVLMSVPLLRMELAPGVREELLSTVEKCALRGAGIVRRVLLFARGNATGRTLLDPAWLVRETAKIVESTFPKSISVMLSLSEKPWEIEGEAMQLQQVLLNLCLNARDAMPEGGTLGLHVENVLVSNSTEAVMHRPRAGAYVRFEVEDSGWGVPPHLREQIFEPFFTTKEPGTGSGLGLSTVAEIVKAHRGFLQLASTPGQGSRFAVYLPAVGVNGPAEETDAAAAPRGRGEMILVVDDEESIRSVTAGILETHGYRVLSAADGQEAVSVFLEHGPSISLVLTDVMMPVMDGLALVRTLRLLSPTTKILASIGEAESAYAADLEAAGLRRPLLKPYTAGELLRVVAEEVGGGGSDQ